MEFINAITSDNESDNESESSLVSIDNEWLHPDKETIKTTFYNAFNVPADVRHVYEEAIDQFVSTPCSVWTVNPIRRVLLLKDRFNSALLHELRTQQYKAVERGDSMATQYWVDQFRRLRHAGRGLLCLLVHYDLRVCKPELFVSEETMRAWLPLTFATFSNDEAKRLTDYRNFMVAATQLIIPRNNKGFLMETCAALSEGANHRPYTLGGGRMTVGTKARVAIYELVGNVVCATDEM